MITQTKKVFVGIDTHKNTHTAVTVDINGGQLDTLTIDTDIKGYKKLADWASQQGDIGSFGVEGTGCYGKNITTYLNDQNYNVVEINRVNRQHRYRHGKTDTTDAMAAARAVASGTETNPAKQTTGNVETIRVIQLARCSAVKARTQTMNQIKSILITAPEHIKVELAALTNLKLAHKTAGWRPADYLTDPNRAVRHILKTLAKRWLTLNEEAKQHDRDLKIILDQTVPGLMEQQGIGTDVAAKLVTAAGSNPERMETEASYAALCGTSPVDASSGMQKRHRLNQGGNRQANNELHTIALTRMSHDPKTQEYVTKKMKEGKTRKETLRQLKRYITRQTYKQLKQQLT